MFFPFLPGKLLVMPQGLSDILASLTAALPLLALALMLRRGAVQVRGVLFAMRLQVIALLGAGAGAFVLMKTVMRIFGVQTKNRVFIVFKGDGLLFILVLAILTALCAWLYLRALKKTHSPPSFALGSLVLPGLLAFAAAFYVPEGSYLLFIPVLFGAATLGAFHLKQKTAAALVVGVGCLVVMLLYVPAVALVYVALGASYAPAAAVMAMLAVAPRMKQRINTKNHQKGSGLCPVMVRPNLVRLPVMWERVCPYCKNPAALSAPAMNTSAKIHRAAAS